MTEMVFYQEPYRQTCSAAVRSVTSENGVHKILCDRTLFYPGGGGQPSDRGCIGGHVLSEVQQEGDEVLHILQEKPSFSPGDEITLELDWDHRFDYMQQHTGQHILSGVMYRDFGIGTAAVHQGEEYTTIETDQQELSEEQLAEITKKAQHIIGENLPVTPAVISEKDEEIQKLRREPKVSGDIRVIRIGEYDRAACGGLHAGSTGEVQLVQCIGSEKIRGRVRTVWKIGRRALEDYRIKHGVLQRIGDLLSVPETEADQRVEKLLADIKQLKYEKTGLRRQLAARIIENCFSQAEHIEGITLAAGKTGTTDPEVIKEAGTIVQHDEPFIFCLLGVTEEELRWVIAVSESVPLPFQQIKEKLLPLIDGKGGGKPPLWQGIGRKAEGAEQFIESFRCMMTQWIREQRKEDGKRE